MNIHAKYQWPKSNNKKVVDLSVVCNIVETKKKNEKSMENKSTVCNEAYI